MKYALNALLDLGFLVFVVLYAVNKGFRDERSRRFVRFALPICAGLILLQFAAAAWWR
jgi:hypothetical protein